MEKCKICGTEHEFKCVLVKAVEFYPDGVLKRVEYLTPADMPQQPQHPIFPAHETRQ
ncbi:hypothetical protein [Bradyrhizobium sp. 150]|uniref:hypothetical protein n=1 Tax=Bradyrhizobium sp. 150 TaxID=2782625 RepID=UPI001FFA3162|nr:hypothetical protein [Bradyrhizobium sp. 150]MCK1670300.1 hypothetical protein [Bradyrhizobium sp. 150]